jgi:apolipoprotein N-acyltransferase
MGRLSRLLREDATPPIIFLIGVVIVIRVIVAIVVWLALFLGVFLGYFTVPILLVSGLTILYSVTDIGLFMAVRRRDRARKERQAFLRAQRKVDELDHDGLMR